MNRPAIPAVRIHQDRGGNWTAHAVTLNYSRPLRAEAARERVRRGRTVFVREEDADAVLGAARGAGASGRGSGEGASVMERIAALNSGQQMTVSTEKFGNVKIWNFQDTTLHFEWSEGRGKTRERVRGHLNPSTGAGNVRRDLLQALAAMK